MYLIKIAERLKQTSICVWCDNTGEWKPFIDSLLADELEADLHRVTIGGSEVALVVHRKSFLETKQFVEEVMSQIDVPKLLVYLPVQEPPPELDVLMELKQAGQGTYKPRLRQHGRNCLKSLGCTDGKIDDLLAGERIGYDDVSLIVEQFSGPEKGSLLRLIFKGSSDYRRIIPQWLASSSYDDKIEAKGALKELLALLRSKLDLDVNEDSADSKLMREKTWLHVLIGELRADLQCEPPEEISRIGCIETKSVSKLRNVMNALRESYPNQYEEMADRFEKQLGLNSLNIDPRKLGCVDTFRFEESALLVYCGKLIDSGEFIEALRVVEERKPSFWVRNWVERLGQWESCGLAAELGRLVADAKIVVGGLSSKSAKVWVDAYTENLWKVDQAHRHLEQHLAMLEGDSEIESALAKVRRNYSKLESEMAEGFTDSLISSNWIVEDYLNQQDCFNKLVDGASGKVGYFLVDALRYEMGQELLASLGKTDESMISAMIARLPSITPVGMSALMPDAVMGMSLEDKNDSLAVTIDGQNLSASKNRMQFLTTRRDLSKEITLDHFLSKSPKILDEEFSECRLLVVRSQEIDKLGESGSDIAARQAMGAIISSIRKAINRLAKMGFHQIVVAADHGFMYANYKGDDMKLENPGGSSTELHRRCWVGKGGHTPNGAVRVNASELGYGSDLDVIFPKTTAVFKAPGGLSFHHGGSSLQEMVVPAITVRISASSEEESKGLTTTISEYPNAITNRMFTMELRVSGIFSISKNW